MRIADKILEKKLRSKGAVLIQDPKWCGKTTTAEQISKSILYMAKLEEKEQNMTLADLNPSLLLGGDKLIEEGVEVLKKLKNKIDTDTMNFPSFIMVLTGIGSYAYRREDGIYIVPIGCLKD